MPALRNVLKAVQLNDPSTNDVHLWIFRIYTIGGQEVSILFW